MDMKEEVSTVLVPLDGSKFAEWALPYAIDAAGKLNAPIELVGVSSRRNLLWQSRVETHYREDTSSVTGGAAECLRTIAQKIATEENASPDSGLQTPRTRRSDHDSPEPSNSTEVQWRL